MSSKYIHLGPIILLGSFMGCSHENRKVEIGKGSRKMAAQPVSQGVFATSIEQIILDRKRLNHFEDIDLKVPV
jgi:hypothetical protein